MKIVLLTPGTGSYHCGVCMRDNALAKELHRQGHDALMLPMYLPLTLDEDAASPDIPIFFGGVSTYLREKVPWLRRMPRWMDRLLSNRALLRLVAGKAAARTGGPDVAQLTLSMLRGEHGNQAGEIEELITWLREHARPDAIWLSTALQAGLARRIKDELRVPVLGFLQGEDSFIDGLGAPWTAQVWKLLGERMRDADSWIAPSQYFANLTASRIGWAQVDQERAMQVVPNGVSLDGYRTSRDVPDQVIGYLARFIPAKGLGLLVDAFILLKKRGRFPKAILRCAGSMTDGDAVYVGKLQEKLRAASVDQAVQWCPNVSREEKIGFFESLTIFSVPATYGEAFGLYVIEALAAGVPVVLPNTAAFPELIGATEGGRLFELGASSAESAERLADALESLLAAPAEAQALGARGQAAVQRDFSIGRLAERLAAMTREMIDVPQPVH
ncbi:MAG TPA: glycosyltransferase family 4 protein [Chthoniobacter sp.]|jgi:glycosyltransferase involved in cell wall biosynthesis